MKPVKGYEGIYSITEEGKVWSHRKDVFIEPKIYGAMKKLGYRLYKDSKGSATSIDTLLRINYPKELDEFKYIKGYEGLYGVSRNGKIWSYTKRKIISSRPTKTSPYQYVSLYINNVGKHFSTHRLVAQTYIENPYGLLEVDHIDRDINNNDASNLRWITRKGNLMNTEAKFLRNFINCQLYNNGSLVNSFKSKSDAAKYAHDKFNVSFSGIMRNMRSGSCKIVV